MNFKIFHRSGCAKLENLNISWCRKISSGGLIAIAHGCSSLKQLVCRGCVNVSSFFYKKKSNLISTSNIIQLFLVYQRK